MVLYLGHGLSQSAQKCMLNGCMNVAILFSQILSSSPYDILLPAKNLLNLHPREKITDKSDFNWQNSSDDVRYFPL